MSRPKGSKNKAEANGYSYFVRMNRQLADYNERICKECRQILPVNNFRMTRQGRSPQYSMICKVCETRESNRNKREIIEKMYPGITERMI